MIKIANFLYIMIKITNFWSLSRRYHTERESAGDGSEDEQPAALFGLLRRRRRSFRVSPMRMAHVRASMLRPAGPRGRMSGDPSRR